MNIRTVSLCIIRKGDQILVQEMYDQKTKKKFYRPIGGTVEYGESSKQTVIREVLEEINCTITEPRLYFIIENIYTYADQIGHEVDFIYEAELTDSSFYDLEHIDVVEEDCKFVAAWKSIKSFIGNEQNKLVPNGLLDLLLQQESVSASSVLHRVK